MYLPADLLLEHQIELVVMEQACIVFTSLIGIIAFALTEVIFNFFPIDVILTLLYSHCFIIIINDSIESRRSLAVSFKNVAWQSCILAFHFAFPKMPYSPDKKIAFSLICSVTRCSSSFVHY